MPCPGAGGCMEDRWHLLSSSCAVLLQLLSTRPAALGAFPCNSEHQRGKGLLQQNLRMQSWTRTSVGSPSPAAAICAIWLGVLPVAAFCSGETWKATKGVW